MHSSEIINVFNVMFRDAFRTVLEGGGAEPMYLPAPSPAGLHRIIFRSDFAASALHEVAHWCIAGEKRRSLVDYGYWYVPDGRNALQQQSFFNVEAKPQALERVFAEACGRSFAVSLDNLDGDPGDQVLFQERVESEYRFYLEHGIPPRARQFVAGIRAYLEEQQDDSVVTQQVESSTPGCGDRPVSGDGNPMVAKSQFAQH